MEALGLISIPLPDALEAMRAAGRGAKTVRRQILLTPFGEDFCRVCLP